ncbi:cornifelin homolog [Aquarana catesbeiana]|uniref:cornifelin homolog n=1 Tax=Aquarana catesbeiana TaxID=8400 RepID=UPI003CCA62B3
MMSNVSIQPIGAQPMSVSQSMTMTNVMQPNAWASGICDCCEDMGVCCCAFWCFPCFQCKTVSDFGECLCLPLLDPGCLAYTGSSMVCPPISMAMRAAVRERYRIPGSICDDCCMLYWCFTCSWCQMAREIKKRKNPVNFVTAQTTSVSVAMNPQPYPQPQAYPQPQPYPQPYQPYPQPAY